MKLSVTSHLRADLRRGAFTLVEVMTAVALSAVVLLLLVSIIGQATDVLRRSTAKIEAFQGARTSYDLLTRNLGQATLNTYLAYDDALAPTRYLRKSELCFVIDQAGQGGFPGQNGTGQAVFFQGPLDYVSDPASYGGLESLLNVCGYYISFTNNKLVPQHILPASNPYRYRLMRMLVPAERNKVYKAVDNSWFTSSDLDAYVTPVADNVIALVVRAQDPGGTPTQDVTANYAYDTRVNATANPQPSTANQLPPVLHITMVTIDEASAKRLDKGAVPPPQIIAALSGKFRNVAAYDTDMDDLQKQLIAANIQFRVFSGVIPLRESKWLK